MQQSAIDQWREAQKKRYLRLISRGLDRKAAQGAMHIHERVHAAAVRARCAALPAGAFKK